MEQDVFDKWQYVQKRGNKYGIRVPVPLDLQPVLKRKEITRSLRTGDPDSAKLAYHRVLATIHEFFEIERGKLVPPEPTPLSPETALSLVQAHYISEFETAELEVRAAINDIEMSADELREASLAIGAETSQALRKLHSDGPSSVGHIAAHILTNANFPTVRAQPRYIFQKSRGRPKSKSDEAQTVNVDRSSEGYRQMLRLVHKVEIELCC